MTLQEAVASLTCHRCGGALEPAEPVTFKTHGRASDLYAPKARSPSGLGWSPLVTGWALAVRYDRAARSSGGRRRSPAVAASGIAYNTPVL